MNKHIPILFIATISLLACGRKNSIQMTDTTTCNTEATVRDYTGLDGCRFLLDLKDGTRLIPVELEDQTFLFSEGQVIKMKYTVLKNVVTACLTAAVPVHVACIEEIKAGIRQGQEFLKRDCTDTDVPLSISWMNKMVIRNKVTEVKKGYLKTDPYYMFFGNAYVQIFNCKGDQICEYELNANSSCKSKYSNLSDLKSVWAQK